MVTRRNLLKIGGITAAGLLTQGSVRKRSRPNILFVFTDQQTWRAMSCAGIPLLPSFRGRSLKAIIDNPKTKWRDYVVTELADDKLDPSRKGRMVRTAQYKYNIYSSGARNEQLFDLKYDPGETQNLAYEPSMKPIVKRHRNLLRAWMRQTNDISCKAISELLSADMERTNDDNEHKIQA